MCKLENGITTNIRTNQDLRLIEASGHGSRVVIQRLINEGIKVNDSDANGITPLVMASSSGNSEAVKVLFEQGAGKDPMDSLGNNTYKTAMFYRDFRGISKEPLHKILELEKPDGS